MWCMCGDCQIVATTLLLLVALQAAMIDLGRCLRVSVVVWLFILVWLRWSLHETCMPLTGRACVVKPLGGFRHPKATMSTCPDAAPDLDTVQHRCGSQQSLSHCSVAFANTHTIPPLTTPKTEARVGIQALCSCTMILLRRLHALSSSMANASWSWNACCWHTS